MHRLRNLIFIVCISAMLLLITFNALAAPARPSTSNSATTDKITLADRAVLLIDLLFDGEASFLIVLDEQADLSAAASIVGKQAKGRFVYDALRAVAQRTQPELIAALREQGAQVRPFIIVNALSVRGDAEALRIASAATHVAYISTDRPMRVDLPESTTTRAPAMIEWGVNYVHAPEVWSMGYTGNGIVVGGQDTGVRWDHEALIDQYRGWNGSSADHDYNWHDAIHSSGGNPCGVDTSEPCDDNSHGTHTVGTIVGDNGAGQQIGVAPGAQWIACRNMNSGDGTPSTYLECFEWFVAPYPIGGTILDGDPNQAPHIINNSWRCTLDEGCLVGHEVISGVQAVRAAGILTVVSAGNAGPGCSSVNEPPAIYAESFSIGAHDSGGNIAGFSSRGPVQRDGSARMKPDISAPGVGVMSALKSATNAYGSLSGTSMAAPHVAGVAALLWDAAPYLIGEVDLTEWVLRLNARAQLTTQGCGGDTANDHPNNVWGWGAIDAQAAVNATLGLSPTALLVAYNIPPDDWAILDASASSDLESPADHLLARWDFQNDGVWDTTWSLNKTITRSLDSISATVAVQIADAGGRTHSASASVASFDQKFYLPLAHK